MTEIKDQNYIFIYDRPEGDARNFTTGFKNREKLNSIGKSVFDLLQNLKKNENPYFVDVSEIYVTELYRSNAVTSAHKKDKAIDIVIKPAYLMPYFAGIIYAVNAFNVYLGTKNTKRQVARHIHIDNDFSVYKNVMGFEYLTETGNINISVINKKNIDYIIKFYDFPVFSGDLKNLVSDLLLTPFTISNKIALSSFYRKKKNEGLIPLPDFTPSFEKFGFALIAAAGIIFLIKTRNKGDK